MNKVVKSNFTRSELAKQAKQDLRILYPTADAVREEMSKLHREKAMLQRGTREEGKRMRRLWAAEKKLALLQEFLETVYVQKSKAKLRKAHANVVDS